MPRTLENLVVREYRPGDEVAILRGFNRAFRRVDPNFQPRAMETWRWQYRNNPAGLRIWLGLTEDGQVINQQAGIPVRVRQDGRVFLWTQIVDSFTDPELARGLKKPGLFIKAATPFYQNYGGTGPEQDAFHYGLPVRAAFRIGKRFLGYEACRNQNKLRLALGRFDRFDVGPKDSIEVEEVTEFPAEVDEFFERAARGRGAIIVRDADHLNWRYVARPDRTYRIAIARESDGSFAGFAVYSRGAFDGESGALLCDWLVEPERADVGRALLAWSVRRARADGEQDLFAMAAETSPEWLEFQRAGFRVEPTRYYMVARSYRPPYDVRWLYWNWYYTLGDFDLC